MTATIIIKMDNAAFNDDGKPAKGRELARIFRELAQKIEWIDEMEVDNNLRIFDVNGNHVGAITIQ